jgi:hypothetical protein
MGADQSNNGRSAIRRGGVPTEHANRRKHISNRREILHVSEASDAFSRKNLVNGAIASSLQEFDYESDQRQVTGGSISSNAPLMLWSKLAQISTYHYAPAENKKGYSDHPKINTF